MKNLNVVEKLISIYGNVHKTSLAVGHANSVVRHWRKRGYIPVQWAKQIHELTNGFVSESEIRHQAAHVICGIG